MKKRAIIVEVNHCKSCPNSRTELSLPFDSGDTITVCNILWDRCLRRVCFKDDGKEDRLDNFIPDWCPLLSGSSSPKKEVSTKESSTKQSKLKKIKESLLDKIRNPK